MSKAILYMLISTLAFSLMNLLVKFLPNIPPHELIFFRSLVSIILSISSIHYYGLNPFGNNKKSLFLRGFIGLISLSIYFSTLQAIPLGTAVTLQNLSPVFTAIFAMIFLGEKLKPLQWLFFAVSFTGVAFIKGFDERISLFWLALGVASAMFSGLAYSVVRKLRDTDHPIVVVFYFPLVSLPFAAIACLFKWVTPTPLDLFFLVMMGICVQVGQLYMTKALHIETTGKVMILQYLSVVYALAFGWGFFGETHGWLAVLGISLVVAGVLLNILYSKRQDAKKALTSI